MIIKLKTKLLTAIIATIISGGYAVAQSDGAGGPAIAQADPNMVLETIMVTARKREESILEAPVAITAFGRQQIQNLGLENIQDVQLYTPGFVFEAFATTAGRFDQSPRFRGIDIDSGDPLRQTASVFVDGVYIANAASGITLSDIERVEVIKGPQSAVFGRNTFGGAVNYITRTPGSETRFDISGSAAERHDYEVSVGLEGAITDNINGRISGTYHFDGGHYANSAVPGEKLGEEETWSITGTLFFDLSDRLDIKVRLNHFGNDDNAPATVVAGLAEHNCGPFFVSPEPDGSAPTAICGTAPIRLPAGINSRPPEELFQNLDNGQQLNETRSKFGFTRESTNFSVILNYDITDNIQLSTITGYTDEWNSNLSDFDRSADDVFVSINDREFEAVSQEIRFSGSIESGQLDWSAGLNYFDQRFTNGGDFIVPIVGWGVDVADIAEENVETLGLFGSLSYYVTDQFNVTFEGRYQTDEVEVAEDIFGDPKGMVLSEEFENFLPRLILEYQVTPDTLVYYSYSEGNLPGTFNDELFDLNDDQLTQVLEGEPNASLALEEEELISNEIGIKHAFADGRGSISSAIYLMKRENQAFRRAILIDDIDEPGQQEIISLFTNAGETEIQGIEIEADYRITDMMQIQGSVGYNDGEFQKFTSAIHEEMFDDDDASGKKVPRYPEWTGSLSLIFNGELTPTTSWFARTDAAYIGERYADETNLTKAPDGTVINLRGGIQQGDVRYELFVKNLTNEDTPTAFNRTRDTTFAVPLGNFSVFGYGIGLRDRRQVGIRVNATF